MFPFFVNIIGISNHILHQFLVRGSVPFFERFKTLAVRLDMEVRNVIMTGDNNEKLMHLSPYVGSYLMTAMTPVSGFG